MQALGALGLTRVLVEGGGRLAASFLAERMIDALTIFRGSQIIGGDGIAALAALGLERVGDAPRFRLIDQRPIGVDSVETYAV